MKKKTLMFAGLAICSATVAMADAGAALTAIEASAAATVALAAASVGVIAAGSFSVRVIPKVASWCASAFGR